MNHCHSFSITLSHTPLPGPSHTSLVVLVTPLRLSDWKLNHSHRLSITVTLHWLFSVTSHCLASKAPQQSFILTSPELSLKVRSLILRSLSSSSGDSLTTSQNMRGLRSIPGHCLPLMLLNRTSNPRGKMPASSGFPENTVLMSTWGFICCLFLIHEAVLWNTNTGRRCHQRCLVPWLDNILQAVDTLSN